MSPSCPSRSSGRQLCRRHRRPPSPPLLPTRCVISCYHPDSPLPAESPERETKLTTATTTKKEMKAQKTTNTTTTTILSCSGVSTLANGQAGGRAGRPAVQMVLRPLCGFVGRSLRRPACRPACQLVLRAAIPAISQAAVEIIFWHCEEQLVAKAIYARGRQVGFTQRNQAALPDEVRK